MADKIIKVRIDVTKLKKEWFFKGEKGTYADVTVLYNEIPHEEYKTNGMVVQDVPKAVYEADKSIKGPVLGNVKDWATQPKGNHAESTPGYTGETSAATPGSPEIDDDLPF